MSLYTSAVVTEGTLPAVEIVITGRDAAVAAINQDGGGLRDIDAIVQGGTEDVVPDQMADDHKDDGEQKFPNYFCFKNIHSDATMTTASKAAAATTTTIKATARTIAATTAMETNKSI